MLVAIPTEGHFEGRRLKAHGIVNRGGFGENWLVVVSIANALHAAIIVEAEHEQSAIDELADSPMWSHLIDLDECKICDTKEPYCDCDNADYAGNDSRRIDMDYVTVLASCDVDYFAKDV